MIAGHIKIGKATDKLLRGTQELRKSVNKFVEELPEGTLVNYEDAPSGNNHARAIFIEALGGYSSQALLKEEKRDKYFLVRYCHISTKPAKKIKYFRVELACGVPTLIGSWDKGLVDKFNVFYLSPIIEVKAELL